MNAAGDVLVATGTDGRIAGVVALANGMRRAVLDLSGGVRRPRTRSPRHDSASAERLDDPKSGLPDPGRKFPDSFDSIPCYVQKIPCSDA